MKLGDLVMLSAAGRKSRINKRIKSEELGIIKRVHFAGGTKLYTVNWMEYSTIICVNHFPEYYRRELKFAK